MPVLVHIILHHIPWPLGNRVRIGGRGRVGAGDRKENEAGKRGDLEAKSRRENLKPLINNKYIMILLVRLVMLCTTGQSSWKRKV